MWIWIKNIQKWELIYWTV